MSAISALAQTFEQNAKQQAAATTQAVESALRQHEQHLQRALQSSEQSLSAAIQAQETSLRGLLSATEARTKALALSGWKWLLGSLLAVILASSGALWWTSQTLAENLALIEQQKTTMARAQALGVTFVENQNGLFIVLPQGMTPSTGWTFDNQRQQAIKLEE